MVVMKDCSPNASAYLRFLQKVSFDESFADLKDLNVKERALFNSLVLSWSLGNTLTVRQAIALSEHGSPATLHKRITRLINKDLVRHHQQGDDRRTKFLQPSIRGLEYIQWLSEQMLMVIQPNPKNEGTQDNIDK